MNNKSSIFSKVLTVKNNMNNFVIDSEKTKQNKNKLKYLEDIISRMYTTNITLLSSVDSKKLSTSNVHDFYLISSVNLLTPLTPSKLKYSSNNT